MYLLIITFCIYHSRIAINPPNEGFNFVDSSIKLEGGTDVLIRVEAEELYTDESVIGVPIGLRKCRFGNEVPQEMTHLFQKYTQNGCLFNCMHAYRYIDSL